MGGSLISLLTIDGNGCTIFTQSPRTAKVFEHKVKVGQIGVNVLVLGMLYHMNTNVILLKRTPLKHPPGSSHALQ